jgi:Uma2 family endonuclease
MIGATVIDITKEYTVEAYFELEKKADIKHEFVNGKLIPMPGESKQANLIASNCSRNLFSALDSKGYQVFQNDVRTIVKDRKIYRYPDVVVAPESDDSDTHHIKKPVLLIEFTSEASSKTDHHDKLKEYASMPSVEYYLIVSQYEQLVEIYIRQSNGWLYNIYADSNDAIDLPKLETQLTLKDIYYKVNFAENKSDS